MRPIFSHVANTSLLIVSLTLPAAANREMIDDDPLALPAVGAHRLQVLSPSLLELTLITTKAPDPERPAQWDFVDANFKPHLAAPSEFCVIIAGKEIPVQSVGFKRRVLYAPLRQRDLRIGNYLYLQLASPVTEGQWIE